MSHSCSWNNMAGTSTPYKRPEQRPPGPNQESPQPQRSLRRHPAAKTGPGRTRGLGQARCWPEPHLTHAARERPMAGTHEPVAMLGLGAMGHAMAVSALRAGIPTIVWDRRAEAAEDLAELGAKVTRTAADAARRAAIVVTMVTDADAGISIARDQGMLAALAPGAIW